MRLARDDHSIGVPSLRAWQAGPAGVSWRQRGRKTAERRDEQKAAPIRTKMKRFQKSLFTVLFFTPDAEHGPGAPPQMKRQSMVVLPHSAISLPTKETHIALANVVTA